MMKRLSLLLAAMFVASMVFVAPVFASGNHENNNGDNEKVCVLHNDKGDDHDNGEHKDYRWVSEDDKHHGDKVVEDKYCNDDHNGNGDDHNGNANGDDNGNANGDDDYGDNGHDDDDNGHDDDDWS